MSSTTTPEPWATTDENDLLLRIARELDPASAVLDAGLRAARDAGKKLGEEVLLSRILSLVGRDRLMEAMRNIDSEEHARQVARRIESVLPGEDRVAAAVGPVLDTADLVEWLGVTKQAIHNRARRHDLLALMTSDGHVVYPDWQFDDDGTTRRGVADAVKALTKAGMDPWTQAVWFRGPSSAFEEMSAAQWLTEGRAPAVVVREAHRRAHRWAQ